jgi:hypothetical protein
VLRTRPGSAPPQICLPSTLLGYGAYLYVDPRFCLQLPSGAHRCYTLAFDYPSPPSGWVWTLPDICVINIDHHHLAAGPCPAHNQSLKRGWQIRYAPLPAPQLCVLPLDKPNGCCTIVNHIIFGDGHGRCD